MNCCTSQKAVATTEVEAPKSSTAGRISTDSSMSSSTDSNTSVSEKAVFDAAFKELAEELATKGSIDAGKVSKTIAEMNAVHKTITKYFPKAMPAKEVLEKVKPVLTKYGFTDDNTLYAQSVCPDEINHQEGDTPELFATYLGEVFHMGGLAGIPFTGKTGFGAFSHHVPDGGHCFVLMAPHIGLSESGKLGSYTRIGQSHDGSCCGAVVGALGHCLAGKTVPDMSDPASADDLQMGFIINQIKAHQKEIEEAGKDGDNAMQAKASLVTHDFARDMLNKVVSTNFGDVNSLLVLFTGIQINMPNPFDGYFQPISMEIRDKKGKTIDIFAECFGK
jgi:hypothetical protein